jgi:hypothetical protein
MNEIILVEGKIDFNILDQNLFNNNLLVVSFDFESHKSLNENNIKHKLVEEYFSEEDKLEIDNLSLKLGTTWYKDKKIIEYQKYEGINLGSLLELEMPSYFFKILKRLIGIKKIIEKENPKKIVSYSLKKYVNECCKKKKIETKNFEKIKQTGLFFDEISIPLSFGITTKNIKISRKNYFTLKKTVDKISNLIWRTKSSKKLLQKKESILLIDFNTKHYEDFLKSFPNSDKNIIILNQRKPAIWNFETLQIIKNSKCKILSIKDFENKITKNKNKLEQTILNKKLILMLSEENLLNTIFSHNQESFWDIIKEEFSEIIINRFSESIERLILIDKMFNEMNIKSVLDWAHTGMEEKEISFFANKRGITIFCLQHGIMTLNPKFEKYHSIMPVLPSNNSKMLVWGKIMEDYLLEHKIDPKQITIVGSPRHDRFFKKNISNNSNTILIASNLFFHYNFEGNDTRAYDRFELYLKEILKYIKKNSNKKPIIKLHQSEYFQISSIIKKIDSTIPIYQHEDILELIETSDTVISLNYSTILLDALILNKPTMVILPEKQNYEEEEIIRKNAVLAVSNISELEIKLKQILLDNNIRNNLILNGKQFINEYFSFQGNSSKILSEFLLNINKN